MQEIDQTEQWLELIRSRRSIRRFKNDPVPSELIDKLLAAANWAPSAHNRQPWRFAVISNQERKQALAAAMGARLGEDLRKDGIEEEKIKLELKRSFTRLTGAPSLILVCMTVEGMDHYSDSRRTQNERTMAVQSTAMAGQNLLLAAHALGLGACWMCAPLFCPESVRQNLDLPAAWTPQGLVAVGFPNERREKTRLPVSDLTLQSG